MKSLTRILSVKSILSLSLFLFVFISCQKETTVLKKQEDVTITAHNNSGNAENIKRINVFNVSQLYDAVNNPANTGSIVELAPGTYILNASYPNAGRIELLENMELQGQSGHPELVIIDASALPGTSFAPPNNFPSARTGAIRLGRGFNSIEWLTVKGNSAAQALSVIDADLIWAGTAIIRITHSIVTGGRIGIDIRNPGTASINRILNAEISNNEIVDNLVQQGQGIEIQNANGASGAVINVKLNGNYVHGNKIGLRSFNNNANNTNTNSGSISIESNADRFDENGIGLYFSAGLNQGSSTTANDNFLHFDAHGSSIKNNQGVLPPLPEITPPCGIYAVGGYTVSTGQTSGNKLELNFWGCNILNNHGAADIIAFAAFSQTAFPSGINNIAEITLNGVSKNATIISTPSSPLDATGTNVINILH